MALNASYQEARRRAPHRAARLRVRNIPMACAVFLVMWLLPTGALVAVASAVFAAASLLFGQAGVSAALHALTTDMNILSLLMYLGLGVVVGLWLLLMRRRARRRAGARRVADVAHRCGQKRIVAFTVRDLNLRRCGHLATLAVGLQWFSSFVMIAFALFAPRVLNEYTELVDESGLVSYGPIWFVATIILPPLVEEVAFRGLALTYLRRAGVPFALANAVQALAFGIYHMNLLQGVYTALMGLALGYVAERYRSLVPAIIVHACFNLAGTLGVEAINALFPQLGTLTLGAIGLVVTVVAGRWIARDTERLPRALLPAAEVA